MSAYFLIWAISNGAFFLAALPFAAFKRTRTEPLITLIACWTVLAFFSVIIVAALSEGGTTVTITEGAS
jgi:branched-subunit amino acid transport protein AzlD